MKYFYSGGIKEEFTKYKINVYNDWEVIKTLWFNAKKALIVSLTNYTCSQLGLFFTGIYLGKAEVAGYGLLLQLLNVVSALSMSVHQSSVPLYSTLRARGDQEKIRSAVFFSLGVVYWIFLFGAIGVIGLGPWLLSIIGSNAVLPATYISVIVFLYRFLQNQHIVCSTFMCSQNKIVDFESSTILGIANFIGIWGILQFTEFGLIGIVVVQFLTALAYPNWKWPYEVCKEFHISFPRMVYDAFFYTNKKIKSAIIR